MTTDNGSASDEQPGALNRQQLIEWQLAEVQDIGHVGTWEFHPPPEKLVWSTETCRIMGVGQTGFDGRIETFLSLIHPGDRATVEATIQENRRQTSPIQLKHRIVRPDGTVRHVRLHGVRYRDESGKLVLAGTVHDITERRQQVARRLEARVPRGSDTVARHGGDEFVIVLEGLSTNQEEVTAQAELVAEKLLAAFNEPFQLDGHQHYGSPSIGVALFDKDMKGHRRTAQAQTWQCTRPRRPAGTRSGSSTSTCRP